MQKQIITADAIRLRRTKKGDLPFSDLTSREVFIYHNADTNIVEVLDKNGTSTVLTEEAGGFAPTPTFSIANESELALSISCQQTKRVFVQVDRDGELEGEIVVAETSSIPGLVISTVNIVEGESSCEIEFTTAETLENGLYSAEFTLTCGDVIKTITIPVTVATDGYFEMVGLVDGKYSATVQQLANEDIAFEVTRTGTPLAITATVTDPTGVTITIPNPLMTDVETTQNINIAVAAEGVPGTSDVIYTLTSGSFQRDVTVELTIVEAEA